jgi:hypothetical protein
MNRREASINNRPIGFDEHRIFGPRPVEGLDGVLPIE